MNTFRLRAFWFDLQDSLWFRPAVYGLLAIMLSFLTIWIDSAAGGGGSLIGVPLFRGGVEGARGVLGAIASVTMTVATTAFSFTLVALQLSSSQYSPRLMRSFTGDVFNQHVLGVFIGTFVYSLLILRVVRSEDADTVRFVPSLSVSIALILAVVCIAILIFFLHHSTRTIQVPVIIDNAARKSAALIDELERWVDTGAVQLCPMPPPEHDASYLKTLTARQSGYIQNLDRGELREIAARHDIVIRIEAPIGGFVAVDSPIATVYRAVDASNAASGKIPWSAIQDGISLGIEPTLERDYAFGLFQLTEIAVRAISKAINDPATAIECIDQLIALVGDAGQVSGRFLVDLAEQRPAVIYHHLPYAELIHKVLDPLRIYGAADPIVCEALITGAARMSERTQPDDAQDLYAFASRVADSAAMQGHLAYDLERLQLALATMEQRVRLVRG